MYNTAAPIQCFRFSVCTGTRLQIRGLKPFPVCYHGNRKRGKDGLNLFPASVCFSGSGVRRSGHARGGQEALYGLPGEPSRCFRRPPAHLLGWKHLKMPLLSCRWRMLITSPIMWQRTSPHTSTGKGKTIAMATTLRCRLWLKCTTDRWRCTSTAQVSHFVGLWGGAVPGITCLTSLSSLPAAEPINTFHGIHQNNDEPIRVSYHRNIHYNSVVNPNKATIGVGLGLPAFKPGVPFTETIPIRVRSKCTFWLFCQESAAFWHSFRE